MTIETDIQSLSPGAIVTLFIIDTTNLGGQINYFHAGTNQLKTNVIWQGNEYLAWPIEAQGFELNIDKVIPRPKLVIANVNGFISGLVKDFNDLVGAKVIRKRTFAKYLDAVNFPGGINPDEDLTAEFGEEIYYVSRKSLENKIIIEFELTALFDVQGVKIPRRQVVKNVCQWIYRSAECSYAGGAVADINDIPTTDINLDNCGKRLSSCKLRFGALNELPYGGFPGAGLI